MGELVCSPLLNTNLGEKKKEKEISLEIYETPDKSGTVVGVAHSTSNFDA